MDVTVAWWPALALTQRSKLQRVNLLDALATPTQTLTCTAETLIWPMQQIFQGI